MGGPCAHTARPTHNGEATCLFFRSRGSLDTFIRVAVVAALLCVALQHLLGVRGGCFRVISPALIHVGRRTRRRLPLPKGLARNPGRLPAEAVSALGLGLWLAVGRRLGQRRSGSCVGSGRLLLFRRPVAL